MPKHIFFDLDNTLMLSRTVMAEKHQILFKKLCDARDVIVVSGAQESQIRNQIPESIGAHFYVLGQTGNQAIDENGKQIWKEQFSAEQTSATLELIEKIKREMNLTVKDPDDLVEERGAQISYSPIGHHETLEKKYAFDPGAKKRREILTEHADDVRKLQEAGVDVVPGGTTCFDFFLAGKTKGFNVARLIEHEGWKKEDSVYVGDALFPGGNDETVIGVIPTHPVKDPDETFEFVEILLK
jgi:phosphomannomutase